MGIQNIFIVECPCGIATPLPPQSPLGIFLPPRPQPNPSKWPANFACSHCGQWFSRSAEVIHLVENASLVRSLEGESFWRVDFPCDQQGCERNIATYIVLSESASSNNVSAFVRANNGLKCPEHGLIVQPQAPTLVQKFPYLFRLMRPNA